MDAYLGCAAAATVLAYCWVAFKDTPSLPVFGVLDGFFTGTKVALRLQSMVLS